MALLLKIIVPALLVAQSLCLCAQRNPNPNIRIGLSTDLTEHIITLEGGGEVCTRAGKAIIKLRDRERLRVWLDSKATVQPDVYRIQVGPPLAKAESDALAQKIKKLGESPESVKVPDGNTWRLLLGSFSALDDAEPLLQKLGSAGFDELWVSSEKKPAPLKNSKGGLYGITERYERIALPSDGVMLRPHSGVSVVEGKGGYRGKIEIVPNAHHRLSVINTLDMESYLRGVVPKEMGAWSFPAIEGLKAQAVAARTYAIANMGKRARDGFDLLDTPLDHAYGGRDAEQSLTDRAVAETAGLIATINGRPIQALYMANGGGATIDNSYVFGGDFSYLRGVSNYPERPKVLTFQGIAASPGQQRWLTWEIARLVAVGLLPASGLNDVAMSADYAPAEFRQHLTFFTKRFRFPAPDAPPPSGPQIYLWMARALQLDKATIGIERPLDATYFLQNAVVPTQDRILAGFLARRGLVTPHQWRAAKVPTSEALQALAKMWAELEQIEIKEGALLLDGQVRPNREGPGPLKLGSPLLTLEEYPGGYLRMVSEANVQIGDKVKWLEQEGGSRLLVRRLDPDGASYDRYNPAAHWKVEMTESELLSVLRSGSAVRSVRNIELKHNEQGRVIEMTVRDGAGGSHRFTGMRIRGALGLKDNVFRVITVGDSPNRKYIFYGRGWGHGVGMDQTAAYGMAMEGYTFDQILKRYYQGITIQPIGN